MFHETLLAQKIKKSKTILFVDFDGTVFQPNRTIFSALFYNLQLTRLLEKHAIPLFVVTGRSKWTIKDALNASLLGLPQIDGVIAGAGTIIKYRLPNGQMGDDKSWQEVMQKSSMQWKDLEHTLWNQEAILQMIHPLLPPNISILPKTRDRYLIRLYAKEITVTDLENLKKTIENHITYGIKVLFTEKLWQKNTTDIFSGDILLVPSEAGKENAVTYILNVIASDWQECGNPENLYKTPKIAHRTAGHNNKVEISAFCFGDATIDVDMLQLKSTRQWKIQTYGVNLQPFTEKVLLRTLKQNPQLHIAKTPAPKVILEIMKKFLSHTNFSPAQNSFARRLVQPFERVLDNVFDKNLTANEISFQGLTMVKESIDLLYAKRPNVGNKVKAIQLYSAGNITDLFDGIRAREKKRHCEERGTSDVAIPGQLADTFCDRAKEFYQLYKRATHVIASKTKQSSDQQENMYQILLAALSCILPSIARAQAELQGIIVKEQDKKGGSMFARTRKLFFSLLLDTTGFKQQSFAIDKKIYATNLATFKNRLRAIPSSTSPLLLGEGLRVRLENQFQPQALERFLFLVGLIQEENTIVEKELMRYPEFLRKYKNTLQKDIHEYLTIDISNERKKHQLQDYHLSLSSLIF